MDRYSTGSTISKHTVYDAFKVVELQTKDNLLNQDKEQNNHDNSESKETTEEHKIENASDITEQILMEAKPVEEKVKEEKVPVKQTVKKESAKVSLKEIDDRLMTIDDFLGDF